MDKKELYSLQNWVNQLGAMQITKPNLMMWINSIPIGPIEEMPHTPLLMYGDLAIDNAIIDIMNQKNVDGGVTTLFNRCRRKNFGQKRRYKFCEERYEEVKVDGLPIRLKYSIHNPRYEAEAEKAEFARRRHFAKGKFANEGTFTDPRDGNVYKTVEIGGKTWLAENLRHEGVKHIAPNGDEDSIAKYGCLYEWENAKKACPEGWHLPSEAEFEELLDEAGTTPEEQDENLRALGWDGTDALGFRALPAGGYFSPADDYYDFGSSANFWSSTEYMTHNISFMSLYNDNAQMYGFPAKSHYFSVRCIKDKKKFFDDAIFMFPETGAVGTYDEWWYDEIDKDGSYTGKQINAVDRGEVVEVVKDENGNWVEKEFACSSKKDFSKSRKPIIRKKA